MFSKAQAKALSELADFFDKYPEGSPEWKKWAKKVNKDKDRLLKSLQSDTDIPKIKSVIIKQKKGNSLEKIIHIKKDKKGYTADVLSSMHNSLEITIINENNERIRLY